MTTIPWPTDIGHIWSLSRDRTLRLWKAKTGCVSSKVLSTAISGRDPFPKQQLIDSTPQQTLLRSFGASSDDQIYVLAFIPAASSSSSGGLFRLITTVADHLHDLGAVECSATSAHCRLQDFMVIDNLLYTLWDHQGQSLVERTVINVESFNDQDQRSWHAVSAYPEPEYTPGYLEKLLLSPGSIVEKGLEVVLRPGAFSINTLRTAIDEYTDACLSLPGSVPPQLTVSYASLTENIANVVGCTVKLIHDAQTGAPQYAAYWSSMKRDWEGFISRCSRLERLGSRPLALGVEDRGNVIIVERERIRALVREDLALYLRRLLLQESPSVDTQYDILSCSWMLSSTLNPQVVANLENRLNDLFRQGITFSLSDIIQDQATRSKILQYVDDGTANWVIGRLQNLDDIDAATKAALDVIGGLDMDVKREEDEVELLLPPANSHWLRSTTAAYTTATINARYDLCLSLVILLFFLSSDLADWDPTLLAEVLAVFRGVAMLRLASRQMGTEDSNPGDNSSADDVVTKMRNMHVSRHKTQTTPYRSLIHHLLADSDPAPSIPGAAHRFLDSSGLLQSVSPAHATGSETLFCEQSRRLRCYDVTFELLAWLPKTPGVVYVQSCLWLDIGRADDAAELLQRLAGSFGEYTEGVRRFLMVTQI
jgi:nuclear pore complex protein Nup160